MSRLSLFLLGFLVPAAGVYAQAPTRTTEIPDQTLNTGGMAAMVDLKEHFGVTGFPNAPIALFETPLGDFYVELLNTAAPKHVENFKKYANDGLYDVSFFHRSSSLKVNETDRLPDIEADARVIQGGGFRILPTGLGGSVRVPVSQMDAVELEYSQPNARGTLAAARGSAANSATSQWFFNLTDNSTDLGQVNGTGGYSVFGRVIGNGMEVVDAIGKLKRYRYSESFNEFPLNNYTSGPVLDQNLALINRVRVVETYPTDASTPGILRFEATSSDDTVVRPKVVGSTLQLTPGKPGAATITVNAYDASRTIVSWSFAAQVNAPRITTGPRGRTVAPGGSVTFDVAAEGSGALAYQWYRNGAAIAGATGESLTLSNLTAADAGDYTVAVSQGAGTTVSRPASLRVEAPMGSAFANLSVRSNSSPSIIGFIVEGPARQLLFRGIGPTLASKFSFADAMPNPKIEIITKNASGEDSIIALNDTWGTDAATLNPIFSQVGAFALDEGSNDAAVVASVSGVATAHLSPANSYDGVALGEIYDLAPGQNGRLTNLSSRTWVGTEEDVVVVGFVIGGNEPRRVLIRAIGPTLGTDFDIYGSLKDPLLEIHRIGTPNVLIASNDDWWTEPEVSTVNVGQFPLPAGSADAAIVLDLPPGAYTATVRGHAIQRGIALVELYDAN